MPSLNESKDNTVRRSILGNLSNTSFTGMNDDEAERAIRRRTLGKSATNVSLENENLVEEQQGLQNCLKIFHDNKISKDNAWTLTIIDNMANLCRSHHKTLRNFQIVGSSLEASTKIYGLRVDSVHSDIVRMSSGLGRMKTDHPTHDREDNDDIANDDTDTNHQNDDQPKAPVKKKRVRKAVSTVTKNKDTLNARLDIVQMPDSLYFKLNSIMGETSSSNKLLLNTIQTKSSDLKLTQDDQFWDNREFEPIELNNNDDYDVDEPFTELPLKLDINPRHTLRQQLTGYTISNTPIDDDDEEPPIHVEHTSFNMSQCFQEYAFDMAAGIEPMPDNDNYAIDYDMDDDGGGNNFEELSQEDRVAISACKGLRRKTTIIEDLRPSDATKLEYSYRPLDNINQFWAGPSYWKFRKSRKLTMNRASVSSLTDGQPSVQMAQAIRRRNNRTKAEPTKFTTLIENIGDSNEDSDDEMFISIDSKPAQKFKKTTLYKRWDSKRLKLPTDLHIDRNLFNYYTFCPSISMIKTNPNATPATERDFDDYDIGDDGPFGTDVLNGDNDAMDDHHHADDMLMMDHLPHVPDVEIPESQQIPDSQNDQTAQEISHHYEGAPEMVQKIDIQFARRAKVIDMKQMKTVCLNTIERQFDKTQTRQFNHLTSRMEETYKDGAASFGIIFNSLPHLLTKTMAENLSPSVAFYSILHLANEHRLRLFKSMNEHDMNVFLIRQLNK